MRHEHELKLLFAGPVGAGKTTAIRSLSDHPPVETQVLTHPAALARDTTPAAMDYGQLLLGEGRSVGLYGPPGQRRFSFMWEILLEGALGVILLIDGSSPGASMDLVSYAQAFAKLAGTTPMVVGVGRIAPDDLMLDEWARKLEARGIGAPVFAVDVRHRQDVLLLVETLLCLLEAR